MKRFLIGSICLFLVCGASAMAEEADAIVGEWYTEESKALVQIYKADDVYNGKIVWLKEPKKEDGSEKLDTNNPDPSKHGDPIIGLNLVNGFVYQGDKKWGDGTIYDPDNGKTYSCKMTLMEDNTLKVRGFIGISLIGRTQVWVRK